MLRWAVGFFVLALIAAMLGFGGIATGVAGIFKTLFWGFLILLVISTMAGLVKGRPPRVSP